MPTPLDHALAIVLAVLFPVRAALFGYRRLTAADPSEVPRVRMWLYRQGIAIQWALTAATVALWAWQGRPWSDLGVVPRLTWGLAGVGVGFTIMVGYILAQRAKALEDVEALARLREQIRNLERMMPRSDEEMRWFGWLAVTAGVCEELLYRGYLIWYLGHWFALVPAVALAGVVFGFDHAYQGPRGILVTSLVGLFIGAVYLVTGSLVAGMVIHALMDLHSGQVARAAYARAELPASLPAEPAVPGAGSEPPSPSGSPPPS